MQGIAKISFIGQSGNDELHGEPDWWKAVGPMEFKFELTNFKMDAFEI